MEADLLRNITSIGQMSRSPKNMKITVSSILSDVVETSGWLHVVACCSLSNSKRSLRYDSKL